MFNFDSILRKGTTPFTIAGPCSAESESQVLQTAQALAQIGITVFRAGLWKPRTRPGYFEGVGADGLEWLRNVKRLTGMAVATEVATALHVEKCIAAGIDVVWIGARTSGNPFSMREISDALRDAPADMTVFVKNPLAPDIEAWIGAVERVALAGVTNIAAVHRGFAAYGQHLYRNQPQWAVAVDFCKRMPEIPMIIDPSHMAGRVCLVEQLCIHALELGFNNLMIECHIDPSVALTDKAQQLTPFQLNELISALGRKSQDLSLCSRTA